jgi:hypothetical protein
MNYNDITVVAIYGNGQGLRAIPAIEKTAACFPGCQKLLVTNELLATDIPQAWIAAPLDYIGYSNFCMYSLHHYVKTDYALLVQHDGWALSKDNWKDDWLGYDYIGGLTHAALIGEEFYTNFMWVGRDNPTVIQNGGFSLRSKKFMRSLVYNGIMPKMYTMAMLNNEDVQMTGFLRPALEKVGIRFAPNDEAALFAFEHLNPDIHGGIDLTKVFGHHSRFRELTDSNTVVWRLDNHMTKTIPMELKVYDLLSDHYGYQMIHEGGSNAT